MHVGSERKGMRAALTVVALAAAAGCMTNASVGLAPLPGGDDLFVGAMEECGLGPERHYVLVDGAGRGAHVVLDAAHPEAGTASPEAERWLRLAREAGLHRDDETPPGTEDAFLHVETWQLRDEDVERLRRAVAAARFEALDPQYQGPPVDDGCRQRYAAWTGTSHKAVITYEDGGPDALDEVGKTLEGLHEGG